MHRPNLWLLGCLASCAAFAGSRPAADTTPLAAFTPVQPKTFAATEAFSSAWADYDADGDFDLFIGARGHSLQVLPLDSRGRQITTGAEVRLFDGSGAVLGTRLVMGGDGYCAQSAVPVHFGLARSQKVSVEVTYFTSSGR